MCIWSLNEADYIYSNQLRFTKQVRGFSFNLYISAIYLILYLLFVVESYVCKFFPKEKKVLEKGFQLEISTKTSIDLH